MINKPPRSGLYSPEFPEEWPRYSLYSLAHWVNGMAFKSSDFSQSGIPIIKIAEIKNGITGQTKLTEARYDKKYLLQDGDMLFCWSGQPETSINTYWWRSGDGWLNQHIFKVLPRPELTDAGFFYQLLRYLRPTFVGIARNKQTTGLGHVTKTDLEQLTVAVPELMEQREIAATLGALDEKIESGKAEVRTLWELLSTEWSELSADAVARPLREVLALAYGKGLPASTRIEGRIPVYGSSGVTGWHSEALIPGPAVVVGRKGTIGSVHWSHTSAYPIDTTFYVRPKDGYPMLSCYFALESASLQTMNSDSAVPGLNRDRALDVKAPLPSVDEAQRWAGNCGVMLERIQWVESNIHKLETLRDALLPELLSGGIRVPAESAL